jgi:hypothetical protein
MRFRPINDQKIWVPHRWLAWYPVVLSDTNETAWLERVWRVLIGYGINGAQYEYFAERQDMEPK